ncbi:hypothetical protein MNBD_GAMMA08-2152 [hydrothermal vent metagenome]|uniref:Uncharacterized protein n=1 Tax=hydrothermal vent metagenome TaxID=652676 RepID=A0A3B0XUG6_9ZZZZ
MTTNRCVYIPFTREQAGDFIQEAEKANSLGSSGKTHHARKFTVICYGDPGKGLKALGCATNTRILIAGHGLAGRPYISNSAGQGQKEYLPFNAVVDRMIESGLQKRYLGTISCDVCYSSLKSSKNPAFADLVSRYLHKKGYRLAHTIGYMGPMGAVHEKLQGEHKFLHRVVDLMDENNNTVTVKSKDAKVRFWGMKSIPKHLDSLASSLNTCPPF